jgi:hypothetical protein
VTVTAQEAVLLPSTVVTVMLAFPGLTAVTVPFVDTEAIAALLLLHVTFLFVALLGAIVGMRVSDLPIARPRDVLLRDTPDTATLPPTVTVQSALAELRLL